MKNHVRTRESHAALLAASAVAIAVVVAGAAGIAADSGSAAPTAGSVKASNAKKVRFERPKLKHRVLTITGTKASDKIALRLRARKPGILQVDVGNNGSADFSFKRNQVARIAVDARAGDDLVRIDERNGVFTNRIRTTIAGGTGNDSLLGGSGAETLLGGDGNETLDGNGGNDRALMGAGDDVFVWDPGDGSDTIEGEAGADTMRFNGANVAEQVDLSANGRRLRFFRVQANITMDTAGVERVDFNALGGADLVTVNDLSGTDVTSLNVDLEGAPGVGDGQPDRVVVNGTGGVDAIDVSGDSSVVKVSGLAPTIKIFQPEFENDRLEVNTLDGNDTVDTEGLAPGSIQLFVDGVPIP
jgi:hypothetical protein